MVDEVKCRWGVMRVADDNFDEGEDLTLSEAPNPMAGA